MFENNQDKFFDEVFHKLDRNFEWDKIKGEESGNFQIEED